MNDKEKLTAEEIDTRLRRLLSRAYDAGFEHAMRKLDSIDDDVQIRRITVTKWGLLAFAIIVFGSVFSFGMYVGRSLVC